MVESTDIETVENAAPGWGFLTNHARALICIAHDPGSRMRDISDRIGITERYAHRIVTELINAGYITRQRNGRRNQYTINAHLPLRDPVARNNIGELLDVLAGNRASGQPDDRAQTTA
ncbi:MAG: MarR family winged helix-turn-helix transcriptional regulator [Actinomycetota bacterium]|nr:MarR family winged helix-turn-helix transcriptional regulator [Actinomycetota bacterium]